MIEFVKHKLRKEIYFYNQKNKNKRLYLQIFFFLINN